MFEIKLKLRWDFEGWVRRKFCDNEVKKGSMLVIWKDIDNNVHGWKISADNEVGALLQLAGVIKSEKLKKLEDITGIKGEKGKPDFNLPDFPFLGGDI